MQMIDSRWTVQDELVDILLGLKHDLGKYFFLHLSHLTGDSPPDIIVDAIRSALFETRKAGGKFQTAADIWKQYEKEIEALDYSFEGYGRIRKCVSEALGMQRFLEKPVLEEQPLLVARIQRFARDMIDAIDETISEVNGEN